MLRVNFPHYMQWTTFRVTPEISEETGRRQQKNTDSEFWCMMLPISLLSKRHIKSQTRRYRSLNRDVKMKLELLSLQKLQKREAERIWPKREIICNNRCSFQMVIHELPVRLFMTSTRKSCPGQPTCLWKVVAYASHKIFSIKYTIANRFPSLELTYSQFSSRIHFEHLVVGA